MKHVWLAAAMAAALTMSAPRVFAQAAAGTALGSVNLPRAAMADGQRLAAGTYQVRLTADKPAPVVGLSPDGSQYVEFVSSGKVVGRALATVIPQAEIAQVAEGPRPSANGARVDVLKGGDYVRVWISRGGVNYLIHLPPA